MVKSPRAREAGGRGLPSSAGRPRRGNDAYARGFPSDIMNAATPTQIAMPKAVVYKGNHIWRYGHIWRSSRQASLRIRYNDYLLLLLVSRAGEFSMRHRAQAVTYPGGSDRRLPLSGFSRQ